MYQSRIFSIKLCLLIQYFVYADSQCPSNFLKGPCSCIESNSSNDPVLLYPTVIESIPIRSKSIVCEHIENSLFDLRSFFVKLSAIFTADEKRINVTSFNDFLLHNTKMKHLPRNLFGNITFTTIILYQNPLLTSIDVNAFNNTRNKIEVFRTVNTSLSDSKTLFSLIREFTNLRFLSMENDKLKSIPDYAFNNSQLRYIWFGAHFKQTSQPIEYIGKYSFYHAPNLTSLRIFSPVLAKIGKYSLAMNRTSRTVNDDLGQMLYIDIGGSMLDSSSFESTSLTRFRNRSTFLRLYNTSIDYLNENVFQPFLESNPSSLLDVQDSNISRSCDSRSLWIKSEYCINSDSRENRVYGTACCSF
ncbi:unnamed protein product [Rotaria magnacalcarata]|uniref:Uncharacterized protein n=4 Tax=Rotaria magnacalcarata TaxID=392030 RepID=A0A819JDQ7_9BILA|nr:unnamed protein product [Rotaria magnacalcarata]CAF1530205.1 unnamed protein product [Rotaria magnacalcarata]CAF2141088.1 unnamed protein product [Rotaria magnacalcarata]CAF3895068.1 unnamed protein product [Rotaria magnacalcarata]CAF3927500.1 unnamed protein product [Rotaria magnacalcarata]